MTNTALASKVICVLANDYHFDQWFIQQQGGSFWAWTRLNL